MHKFEEVNELNAGIEEALNCYDEEQIMSIILNEKYSVRTYLSLTLLAEKMTEINNLFSIIRKSQLEGNNEYLSIIGLDKFNKISKYFDTIYYPYIAPVSVILDEDKRKEMMKNSSLAQTELFEIFSNYTR